MIKVNTVEIKDHWEIVIELTNDDSSETVVAMGCRTLRSKWEIVKNQPTGLPRSIGMLLRIPINVAKQLRFGLDYAICWYL